MIAGRQKGLITSFVNLFRESVCVYVSNTDFIVITEA